MENVIKIMAFLGAASLIFFLFSKVLKSLELSNSKIENTGAVVLIILLVVAFVMIFGFEGGTTSSPWERLQRR